MNARIAKTSHLGERRFHEYPQIVADEWSGSGRLGQHLLSPARLIGGLAALAALAAGAVIFLR